MIGTSYLRYIMTPSIKKEKNGGKINNKKEKTYMNLIGSHLIRFWRWI